MPNPKGSKYKKVAKSTEIDFEQQVDDVLSPPPSKAARVTTFVYSEELIKAYLKWDEFHSLFVAASMDENHPLRSFLKSDNSRNKALEDFRLLLEHRAKIEANLFMNYYPPEIMDAGETKQKGFAVTGFAVPIEGVPTYD